MLRILRLGVLVVMTFMTLSLIIALARPETGPIEKGLLVAAVVAVVLAACPVQRLASSRF
jgi:tryptophan-rich sensory protein